jgi:predicted alpha-1,2-mannosidase
MLINVGGSVNGDSDASAQIVGNDEVTGSASSTGFCGRATPYTVYFAAQFSRPFTSFGTWNGATVSPGSTTTTGGQAGAYVTFDTTQDPMVLVKVGVSFVSVQNAVLNLRTEHPSALTSAGFDAVHTAAGATWNAMLSRIQISGGTAADEQRFYTALYHALLHPNVFSDVNGQYPGFDHQVHSTQAYTQYANYSGWDIYRTDIPLLALLAPRETGDMMQSLVADAQQSGWLPRWAVANDHAGVMVGDPADPIIAGAYAFGATHFDTGAALQAMIKGATQSGAAPRGYVERPHLRDYVDFGYIPRDHDGWSAARTLEYSTADFSIAQFAQALGDTATFNTFMRRAQSWQNLFNPATGYIQPRLSDGEFVSNFNPASGDGYIEGNGAQYTWMVPYNLHALFNAMGGNQRVAGRLDSFFTQLNAGPDAPYSWLGNEPDLEAPWAYDFAGAPWRTQAVVRQAMNQLFSPHPGGLPGNDDLGTVSAWYVWAALGLYPEIPGVGDLVIGSPLFPQITLHLAHGEVTITAPGASDTTPYVQSLTVDCQPYSKPWLPLAAIAKGATLQFTLGTTPNSAWGADRADAPPSFAIGEAPAIGFTSSGNGDAITVTAGSSQSFQLGVQGVTDAPLVVQWSASPPSGLQLDATTGTVAVSSAASRTHVLTVAASISVPPGDYIIPFHLHAVPSGQGTAIAMPPMDVEVVVNSPPPTATLTTMPVPPAATPASPTNTNAPTLPTATRIATRAASRPIARRVTHMRKPVLRGNMLRSIVIRNGTIIVNVRTAPRMRVRVGVQPTPTTYFVTHRGRHRRRVARAVVLYATTLRTKANNTARWKE